MTKRAIITSLIALSAVSFTGCNSSKDSGGTSSGTSGGSSTSTATTDTCTSPVTSIIDVGERRVAGAALSVRGAYTDIKLIPGTNYPAVVFNETNTTANALKYQYWNGSSYKIETIHGGTTDTYVSLVFLSNGRPLVFWGNGATRLFMASRSTASYSTEGTWTVSVIDSSSTAIKSVEANVNPLDQVMVAYVDNTSGALKAMLCSSTCQTASNYATMATGIDATVGNPLYQIGTGWCKQSSTTYYPMIVYGDTANAMLVSCRNSTLSNCATNTNWATTITLTGSGTNLVASEMYLDSTTTDATVYMAVKHTGGIRPYTFASCATSAATTSADPGTNYISATATVGASWLNIGFGGGQFHVFANDGTTMVKYFNQSTASFGTGAWATTASPVETTGAAGIAAAGATRGGMVVDTTGDQILAVYGRAAALTPTQTYGNIVMAYNDCPNGQGTCSTSTLGSPASSTAMYFANSPIDSSGQIQRVTLQVPSVAAAVTSTGRPATAYIDYSIATSAEPVTGALLKYAYRDGASNTDKWINSPIPTSGAPMGPGLAFDHLDRPWVSWYESSTGTGGFRYYLAMNNRSDGVGLWTIYAFPLPDAAAPTLPVFNQTAMAMYWSGGIAKPVMFALRNPAASKAVWAGVFNSTTNQWDNVKSVISLAAAATTPGGGWITADNDTSGNVFVAVSDLGTGAGASCSPTTSRCVRATYSSDGGATWGTAAQLYSGTSEGLEVKINPSNSRPAMAFYDRASGLVRYKYCNAAMASCLSSSNWLDLNTGVIDTAAGVAGLTDTTNIGLLNVGLAFSSDGNPWVAWGRGTAAVVSANLMYATVNTAGTDFNSPSVLRTNGVGNDTAPAAAYAGNFAMSWNSKSVRSSATGAMHTVYVSPGNFLSVTSCGN